MKDNKDNKYSRLDGKKGKGKISTAQAIAHTRKNRQPKLSKSLEKLPITIIDKSDSINNPNTLCGNWSFKDILTQKEVKFLTSYLSGGYTIESAMIEAGYTECSQRTLYDTAARIRSKIELQADDHKKLFRELGAGEILVVRTLLSLIEDPSAKIRLGAVTQLAKILDLTKEQLDGAGGVTIIFEGSGTPGAPASLPGAPGAPPLPPSQGEIRVVPVNKKPMMITK